MRSFVFNIVKKFVNLVVKLYLKVIVLGLDFVCICKYVYIIMLF